MSAAEGSADVCDVPAVVQMIHDSPVQACIYATGGGMQASAVSLGTIEDMSESECVRNIAAH